MFVDLEVGPYRIKVPMTYGPRVLGLRREDGPELFAQLPENVVINHPESGTYRLHGGHRLWVGPEVPSLTYADDAHRCEVATIASGFAVRAPADAAGFVKEIIVTSVGDGLVVDHVVTNTGDATMLVAAWSLTQFPLGGTAIMPVIGTSTGAQLQADASVMVWPYTKLTDSRLSWLSRAALVHALAGPRFKIGTAPNPGKLGFLDRGHLFTKTITPSGTGEYPDRGAVGQVFVKDEFCELESMGPLTLLETGQSVTHRETWEATVCASLELACQKLGVGD